LSSQLCDQVFVASRSAHVHEYHSQQAAAKKESQNYKDDAVVEVMVDCSRPKRTDGTSLRKLNTVEKQMILAKWKQLRKQSSLEMIGVPLHQRQ
jgi:hypothetical protein